MSKSLQIFRIKSCWPTTFLNGIPLSDMLNPENRIQTKYDSFNKSSVTLDLPIIDFIFNFCEVAKLSSETSESSLILFDYYMSHEKNLTKFDFQLVAMTCIFLSSKICDIRPLSLSILHKISDHIYNNSMVLNCEKYLLNLFDFDIFIRDNLLIDRVGLYLENIRNFMDENDFIKFTFLCENLVNLIFEDYKIIKMYDLDLLSSSLIQAGFVIGTKREGKLPITIKLSIISGVNEDEMIKLSKKIIKFVLGKDIYKQFNF